MAISSHIDSRACRKLRRWVEGNPKQRKIHVLAFVSVKLVLQVLCRHPPRVTHFLENPVLSFGRGIAEILLGLTFRSASSGGGVSIAFACIFLALKVRLVPVSFEDPEFKSSLSQSFSLYVKYQMAIHQDPPEECGKTEVPFVKRFPMWWACVWRSNRTFLCHFIC